MTDEAFKNLIEVTAIVLAPLITWIITILYQNRKEKREAKIRIFLSLMGNRKKWPPSEAYLDSLNLIDVVFQKDKKVRRAWKEYYDSLNGSSPHFENRNSFLLDLLSEMAESLGYKHLKQTEIDKFYSPQYYGTQQTNQQILFQEFLRVLIASKSMGETYSEAEAEKHKEEMRKNLNLQ